MAKHNDVGRIGENLAASYLQSNAYQMVATNWHYRKAEIDIIAKDAETLVFVEVKTRSTDLFGQPTEAISPRKKRLLADAAAAYMEYAAHEGPIRFDIISIIYRDEKHYTLEHFEDAFFPGLE